MQELTRGDMHEHLEVGALLGELAEVLHPHHVHVQGHVIPAVQCSADLREFCFIPILSFATN